MIKLYTGGDCLLEKDVIIVKRDIDIGYENGKVWLRDNSSGEVKNMIDLSKTESFGFGETEFQAVLNNFADVKKYCYAEITLVDIIALISVLLNSGKVLENKNVKMLEVGSWGGASSYILAYVLSKLSKKNSLFCMDTWKGTPNTKSHNIANFEDMFLHFRNNMQYFGVNNVIIPIITESKAGFKILQDHTFDYIFIDAAHTYSGVRDDIEGALEKLKPGGILIGHDCECYYDELPFDNMNKDVEEEQGYHVGVIKALSDMWGRNYKIVDGSKIWYKTL